MTQLNILKHTGLCTLFFSFFLMNGATQTVLNLLDNGSPGSLRETIASANPGDTIIFALSGIIFLDENKGELVINKSITIDGEEKIIIDGQNKISTCFHVFAGDHDVNFVSITIQYFSNESTTEPEKVNGILVDNQITQCTVHNCTIQKLTSTGAIDTTLSGINVQSKTTKITNNVITELTLGTNPECIRETLYGIQLTGSQAICSNNTVFNCWSGNSNQISAKVVGINYKQGTIHCSDNVVYNCRSGQGTQESGSVEGMSITFIKGVVSRNTISHCFSGKSEQISGQVLGLVIGHGQGVCSENKVSFISSGSSNNQSGNAEGINFRDRLGILGTFTCIKNKVWNITTGDAIESGLAIGIFSLDRGADLNLGPINIIENLIDTIYTGKATLRGSALGIVQSQPYNNSQISCNTITNISGRGNTQQEDDPLFSGNPTSGTRGILLRGGDKISVLGNAISNVRGEPGALTAGIQLGKALNIPEPTLTNSTISHNTIKNINSQTSGFGIIILAEDSYGNSILNNSIFNTTDKAISIGDSETLSIIPDAIVTLSSVSCIGDKKIRVTGIVKPQAGLLSSPFLLQFFVSDTTLPSQTKTLIFEYLMAATEGNTFDVTLPPAVPTSIGQYISTTATAQVVLPAHNWNTSEVSNGVPACNSIGASYIKLVCPKESNPPALFDCNSCLEMLTHESNSDIL